MSQAIAHSSGHGANSDGTLRRVEIGENHDVSFGPTGACR